VITLELLSPGKHLPADYWTRCVPGSSRTEIEIGPGDGKFLIEAARRDPVTVWVGLEIRASMAHAIGKRSDLPVNVAAHHCDGRWVVEHLIAEASVDAFHLYFPDPWWKKRHHKRRLFGAELGGGFAAALRRGLKPRGVVYFLTDVEIAFREAAEQLSAAGLVEQPWSRAADDPAQSSYERKYRRQGRTLWSARFTKSAARVT
jgi:tRNA (guanine-N7-)-methyltransferase